MITNLQAAYEEERAAGWTDTSALALVYAAVEDADERGITESITESLIDVVKHLGEVYSARAADPDRSAAEVEQLRHCASLSPGLVAALETLIADGPAAARARLAELAVLARSGALRLAEGGS